MSTLACSITIGSTSVGGATGAKSTSTNSKPAKLSSGLAIGAGVLTTASIGVSSKSSNKAKLISLSAGWAAIAIGVVEGVTSITSQFNASVSCIGSARVVGGVRAANTGILGGSTVGASNMKDTSSSSAKSASVSSTVMNDSALTVGLALKAGVKFAWLIGVSLGSGSSFRIASADLISASVRTSLTIAST